MAHRAMTVRLVTADHVVAVIAARAVTGPIAVNDQKLLHHMMIGVVSVATGDVAETGSVVVVEAAEADIPAEEEEGARSRRTPDSIARRPTSLRWKAPSPAGLIRRGTVDSFGSR
jgi:hypothetical protein